jgi:hypothetical protein
LCQIVGVFWRFLGFGAVRNERDPQCRQSVAVPERAGRECDTEDYDPVKQRRHE